MKMHNAFLSQFRKFFIVIIVSLRGIIYAAYNHRIESAADERIFVPSFINYLNYILQRENKYQENSFVPVI